MIQWDTVRGKEIKKVGVAVEFMDGSKMFIMAEDEKKQLLKNAYVEVQTDTISGIKIEHRIRIEGLKGYSIVGLNDIRNQLESMDIVEEGEGNAIERTHT